MSTEQAYISGFIKRAAEYGLDQNQAEDLLKQSMSHKESAEKDTSSDYHMYADDFRRTAKMIGRSDKEADSWYKKFYNKAKKMKPDALAKEMKRVHYNRGYDKVEG